MGLFGRCVATRRDRTASVGGMLRGFVSRTMAPVSAACFHSAPASAFGKLNQPNLDDILNPKLKEQVAKQLRVKATRMAQARESKARKQGASLMDPLVLQAMREIKTEQQRERRNKGLADMKGLGNGMGASGSRATS